MMELALDPARESRQGISAATVAGILIAHLAVLGALIATDVVPNPLAAKPLMVITLPEPPRTQPPRPPAPQKAPRPAPAARQTEAAPALAAKTEAPASHGEAAEKPMVDSPAPRQPAPTDAPTTQPRFDANYLDNPAPAYPALSRRMGEEGKVFLRVFVEADGRASQIEIKTSSGSPRLDQAAEQAVRRWRFVPAKRGNEAVSAWVVVPISFNLKG